MNSRPLLSKAPIIEAILDIQVRMTNAPDAAAFKAFHQKVTSQFPVYEPVVQIEGHLRIGDKDRAGQLQEKKADCARLKSADSGFISLLRPAGMNLSRLKPYSNWADLRDRAKSLWSLYKSEFRPASVSRVALRYINKVNVSAGDQVVDFFRTYPQLSPSLPQDLAAYRLQMVLPNEDKTCQAIINQIFDPKIKLDDDSLGIIFDIDVFQETDLHPDSDLLWSKFETLHNFKNDIFFESLTESARKRYL